MNPERGRKQSYRRPLSAPLPIFQNVNPERGRKQIRGVEHKQSQQISEREPRKGTETGVGDSVRRVELAFQNVNPERGRKPKRNCCSAHAGSFQNVNPERGRKLFDTFAYSFKAFLFQNVNPERGRKPCRQARQGSLAGDISEREPRKGTETDYSPDLPAQIRANFRT